MKYKKAAAAIAAFAAAVTLSGCAAAQDKDTIYNETEIIQPGLPEVEAPPEQVPELPEEEKPEETPTTPGDTQPPAVKNITYMTVTSDGVNIRSGSGTSYTVLGTAEKQTLYAYLGEENGWYKTQYKNKAAYISKKYCVLVDMQASENDKVEAVVAEGAKLLGTPYVFGATRYHDGSGNKLKGFSVNAFDCSSLMQYAFYKGADELLTLTTRTQVKQGTTVGKAQLQRGDLMFFTNESRKNNTGVERIGHVALYLGDNYILHTASDYAKIEQISAKRWSFFIQAQRML
ncbi:MAG: C40 family peptidase [Clostridia bacterium]|nr:C40 family peptidase [Clostridia bacterium]